MMKVLGSGADGLVRKMHYRGRTYAVKSIYPLYDKQTAEQPKVPLSHLGDVACHALTTDGFRAHAPEKRKRSNAPKGWGTTSVTHRLRR